MKIVLDCANGAAYEAMPKILRRLGADVIVIHDKPNGININDNCGSTHLESLMEAVKEQVIARMKMCGCDGKAK